MEMGEAIKLIMDNNKILNIHVQNNAGVSESTLKNFIQGNHFPNRQILQRVLEFLSIEYYDLLVVMQGSEFDRNLVLKKSKNAMEWFREELLLKRRNDRKERILRRRREAVI